MPLKNKDLFHFLEEKYYQYNRTSFIDDDPVKVPHCFNRKEDIEIAAFLTSSIAWGNRKAIIKNAFLLMERMDNSPFSFVNSFSDRDLISFSDFYYRTFNGTDCMYFLKSLKNIYHTHGSLEAVFQFVPDTDDPVRCALIRFRELFFSIGTPGRSEKHISSALKHSACKRLNLFLRWMVRKDKQGVDFGIWKVISPAQLMCPLDLHSGRVARKLGLLQRKQNDWHAVSELTAQLRSFDPNDPVKYDFALFGMGVFERF
jgi:uncharacterized protein (TIGR02757 family)